MSALVDFSPRSESVQIGLELMLAELESSQLEVVLVPTRRWANEGGCVRVAISRNCDWYRRFCGLHGSDRVRRNALFDTRIKRRAVVRLLGRLIAGEPSRSKYVSDLLAIAEKQAERAIPTASNRCSSTTALFL